MKFIAVDVETANPKMSSICQIGIAEFDGDEIVFEDSLFVDPDDYFDPIHKSIHGITETTVAGQPKFSELHEFLEARFSEQVVACHTHFDRVAMTQACERYGLPRLPGSWLDTARVARRAWPQFSKSGYGLSSLAAHFGIEFEHHDALEDARAAGMVLARAINETGINAAEWVSHSQQRMLSGTHEPIRREAGEEGPLLGEVVVFTGALQIARRDAADLAHAFGGAVAPSVTKKTTLLVVGDQDIERLAGHSKSTKHRKAEKLIAAGQSIRILGEADFMHFCETQ